MSDTQPQGASTSSTVRRKYLLGFGAFSLAATGTGFIVDVYTAIGLGKNALLMAAGFAFILLSLGLVADKLRFQVGAAVAVAAIVSFMLGAGLIGAGLRGEWGGLTGRIEAKDVCGDGSENSPSGTYARPVPKQASSVGLTFCPVNLNDGRAVKGRYTLSGSVAGTAPEGREVALVLQPDPETCDTKGNHGTGGYYFVRRMKFIKGLAAWQFDGMLPYPESSSIKRNFYYVVAPPEAIESIQQDYEDNSGRKDYVGMKNPPSSLVKVSSFSYTPGLRKDC